MASRTCRRTWRRRLLLLLLFLGIFLLFYFLWPLISPALIAFLDFVAGMGFWGPAIISGLIIISGFPFIQGYFVFCLAAGFLFRLYISIPLVYISANVSCLFGFTIARYLLKSWVVRKLKVQQDDKAVEQPLSDPGELTFSEVVQSIESQAFKVLQLV